MEDTTKEFKKKIALIFFFPILLISIFLILSIIFFCKKNFKNGFGFIFGIILIIVLFLLIPYPPGIIFKDYNNEIQQKYGLKPIIYGRWVTIYDLGNNKVLKQISAPGVSHQDFNHVSLPTLHKKCTRKACTIPCIIAHTISTKQMWLSIERILKMSKKDRERFFPKIYYINPKKKQYICEKIKYKLSKKSCPDNFKQQIIEFNNVLKKYGLYVDDVHEKNIMVDENMQIKIVDGELYTDEEYKLKQSFLDKIDDKQNGSAKGYKYGDRIRHWVDGRLNGEDICLNEKFINFNPKFYECFM